MGGPARVPIILPQLDPPPPPRRQAEFNVRVEAAETARAAGGGLPNVIVGAPDIRPTQIPQIVAPGDNLWTLTGGGEEWRVTVATNSQLGDPNLIYPDEAVFIHTSDPKTVATRTAVHDAVVKDRQVARLETRKANAEPGSLPPNFEQKLSTARREREAAWENVQSELKRQYPDAGNGTGFPVSEIAARVPESRTFQTRLAQWQTEATTPPKPPGANPPGSNPPDSNPPGSNPPGSSPPNANPPGTGTQASTTAANGAPCAVEVWVTFERLRSMSEC